MVEEQAKAITELKAALRQHQTIAERQQKEMSILSAHIQRMSASVETPISAPRVTANP